jgi:hypothetical protein
MGRYRGAMAFLQNIPHLYQPMEITALCLFATDPHSNFLHVYLEQNMKLRTPSLLIIIKCQVYQPELIVNGSILSSVVQ